MIEDLQQTILLVRENHAAYGIDPDRMGVMGFSAGRHLAGTSMVFYDNDFLDPLGIEPRVSLLPDFVAMIYPVVTMLDPLAHKRSRRVLLDGNDTSAMELALSLEQNTCYGMSPVFLVHCRDDRTVDYRNSAGLAEALDAADVPCRFLLYDEGGHGFGIKPPKQAVEAARWPAEFLAWLESTLGVSLDPAS